MYTSGTLASMTGQGSTGNEKVAIQAVQVETDNALRIYAQSQGGPVTITNVIVRDAGSNVIDTVKPVETADEITADLSEVEVTGITWKSGTESYTVSLISEAGNTFVSTSFRVTAP